MDITCPELLPHEVTSDYGSRDTSLIEDAKNFCFITLGGMEKVVMCVGDMLYVEEEGLWGNLIWQKYIMYLIISEKIAQFPSRIKAIAATSLQSIVICKNKNKIRI